MAKDRVHPLKFEDPSSGGTEFDDFPTSLDKNEDYLDARGVTFQDNTTNDEQVYIDRDAVGNLVFRDSALGVTKTLTDLSTGASLSESEEEKIYSRILVDDSGVVMIDDNGNVVAASG